MPETRGSKRKQAPGTTSISASSAPSSTTTAESSNKHFKLLDSNPDTTAEATTTADPPKESIPAPAPAAESPASKPSMAASAPVFGRKYFLLLSTRDHILSAVQQGIAQVSHGSYTPLTRMMPGDGIVFYASKETIHHPDDEHKQGADEKKRPGKPCKRFIALGVLSQGDVYQEVVSESWKPWRRKARFLGAEGGEKVKVKEVPLKDVKERLDCVKSSLAMRAGWLEMRDWEWDLLWQAMVGRKEREDELK